MRKFVCTILFFFFLLTRLRHACFTHSACHIPTMDSVAIQIMDYSGVFDQAQLEAMARGQSDGAPPAAFDTPAFVSDAWMSTVRGPTKDEVSNWYSFADVGRWAKLKGDVVAFHDGVTPPALCRR